MGNKIQRIYIGTNQVRPPYKWEPSSDTALYIPFKEDVLDHSGNGVSFTNSGVSVSDGVGVFNGGSRMYTNSQIVSNKNNFTACCWARRTNNPSDWVSILHQYTDQNYNYRGWGISFQKSGSNYPCDIQGIANAQGSQFPNSTINEWYHFLYTSSSSNTCAYINGVLIFTGDTLGYIPNWFAIGAAKWYYSSGGNKLTGNISEVILENKVRTAEEVTKYYNRSKNNYS